jgi:hypothetical protein
MTTTTTTTTESSTSAEPTTVEEEDSDEEGSEEETDEEEEEETDETEAAEEPTTEMSQTSESTKGPEGIEDTSKEEFYPGQESSTVAPTMSNETSTVASSSTIPTLEGIDYKQSKYLNGPRASLNAIITSQPYKENEF